MAFAADHMVSHIYRVEVSGWDQEKSYFVEKSELEWDESGEKYVTLTREIPKDSMVFVRLLQAMSQQQSFRFRTWRNCGRWQRVVSGGSISNRPTHMLKRNTGPKRSNTARRI